MGKSGEKIRIKSSLGTRTDVEVMHGERNENERKGSTECPGGSSQ
jgi:hypothetical protein